jgi:hypothetical protein
LELSAAAETDPARARTALAEAYGIWRETGAAIDSDRVLAALGRLPGASTDDRLSGLRAAERLAALDVLPGRPVPGDPAGRAVAIRALGRFSDRRRPPRTRLGLAVPQGARPAAHPGRPARPADTAGGAGRLLWPDDDPGVLAPALGTAVDRADRARPEPQVPQDQFVIADQASVALDIGRLRVDVETSSPMSATRCACERGAHAQARAARRGAAGVHRDAFEDRPYADWTGHCAGGQGRVPARATGSRRTLSGRGRHRAGRLPPVQLLHRDPYDGRRRVMVDMLAADGRHGEARLRPVRRGDARHRRAAAVT